MKRVWADPGEVVTMEVAGLHAFNRAHHVRVFADSHVSWSFFASWLG